MPKSELEKAIERYRADLLANESKATLAIANAYKVSRERLIKRIEVLAESIAEDGAEFTPSQVLKWQRAKTLLRQIEAEMGSLATASAQPITDAQATAVDLASEQAKGLAVATAQSAGADAIAATIDTTWNRLNTGAAEAIVGRMSDGSPLNTWLDQFGKKASGIIAESLQSAAALGTNPRAVARELAKQLDISAARLLLMSRTEVLRAHRTATLQQYQANADILKGWIWLSAKQTRTCAACLAMDGTFHEIDETMASHPNCRCTMRPALKNDPMRKVQTGKQWLDKQPPEAQDAVLGKAGGAAYRAGEVELQDFVKVTESADWGKTTTDGGVAFAKMNAARRESISRVGSRVTRNYEGIEQASAQIMDNQVNRLLTEYPEVGARLKYVGTGRGELPDIPGLRESLPLLKNASGLADANGEWILFNTSLTDPQKLRSLVSHEFGHALDATLDNRLRGKSYVMNPRPDGRGEGYYLRYLLTKEFPPTEELSRYSMSNTKEAFAEAFSALKTSPGKSDLPIVRATDNYIEKARSIRLYNSDEGNWLSLSREEAAKLDKEMDRIEKQVITDGGKRDDSAA